MSLTVSYSALANIQYSAPTAGQTITVGATTNILIIEPAGLLATLTVNLPSGITHGWRVAITCTQIVTTLTFGGGTIINGITTFAAGIGVEYVYNGVNGQWYRTQ